MTATVETLQRSPRHYRVVMGGLVAGALDIVYACTFWAIRADVSPRRILQSIAAGLLGPASFKGGTATATLGLALHFFIALCMAAAYAIAAVRWPVLALRPVACGAAYGLMLYATMNFVVVPLSAAAPGARDPLWIGASIAAHVALIGIPIALAARAATPRAQERR